MTGHWAETARPGEGERPKALAQPLTHPDSEKGGLWARTAEGHLLLSFCRSVVSDFL